MFSLNNFKEAGTTLDSRFLNHCKPFLFKILTVIKIREKKSTPKREKIFNLLSEEMFCSLIKMK